MDKVNALVFEGGATWGIAYIGALSELFKRVKRENIKSYCGTSVGSIMAFALAIGLTIDDIEELFWTFRSRFMWRLPLITAQIPFNLLTRFGLLDSGLIRQLILGALKKAYPTKNDISFKDIPHDLIIPFTILNNSYYIVGSKYSTPDMSAVDAVVYSCSGNLAFSPNYVKLLKLNKNLTIVDGGISNMNYPLSVYTHRTDPAYILENLDNRITQEFYNQFGGTWQALYEVVKNQDDNQLIGFRFGDPDRFVQTNINDLLTYLWVLSNVLYTSLFAGVGSENRHSIWINVGLTFAFDFTNLILPNRIYRLKEAGRQAVITSKIFT